MLRGTSDPDIIVKRPAESRGGMTVTIFKVGTMDWSRISNSFIISRINASLSTLCDYQYMIANVCLACSEQFCLRVYVIFHCSDFLAATTGLSCCDYRRYVRLAVKSSVTEPVSSLITATRWVLITAIKWVLITAIKLISTTTRWIS